jgi:hypothetical protein
MSRYTVGLAAGALLMTLGCSEISPPTPEAMSGGYNLSPRSRTLKPISIFASNGPVAGPSEVLNGGSTVLKGQGNYLIFDFGKEVGGIVTIDFGATSDGAQSLAMAFSESSLNAGMTSDLSNGGNGEDGSLPVTVRAFGSFITPTSKLRGGFRYLTIGLATNGWVELTGVEVHFTAAPQMSDLRAYSGSFLSSDDLLNRIWYAGAYTVQMDSIVPQQGRVWPPPAAGWLNNGLVGSGDSVLADGAKRDRSIWPGDLGISAITDYVAFGDTVSIKNDLDTLFARQDLFGCFPYSGPEMNFGSLSDAYHLWTLSAALEYYVYSNDRDWLAENWPKIRLGIEFSEAKIDRNGLFSVTLVADWGRLEVGGEEMAANALLYHVLREASAIAPVVGDSASASLYESEASSLRQTIEARLWDPNARMYRDTPGSSLHPQDGNSLALWFGIPETTARSKEVSANLRSRWNSFGAVTPERPGGIATFPGSMEVMAHFVADDDESALDLIRREWGYMLSSPMGTGSTFWEGFLEDGSFDYGGSYVSLAHGWATGPTAALTEYVAGVGPELSSTAQFHFIPHTGDLYEVSAIVPLPKGVVGVNWRNEPGRFIATVRAPASASGVYGIPVSSDSASVLVDGQLVWSSCASVPVTQFGEVSFEDHRVYLNSMAGSHTVAEYDRCSR